MNDFQKVVRLGTVTIGKRPHSVFCAIEYKSGRLSISGVVGPRANGNCYGSAGQIVMSLGGRQDTITPAPGWNAALVAQFFAVWERWHLNDMQAGSPAQMEYLRAHPVTATYPESHYTVASAVLKEVGLNPDPNYLHAGKPYKYGDAWLYEAVPEDVLEFLRSLPDTDTQPAWV